MNLPNTLAVACAALAITFATPVGAEEDTPLAKQMEIIGKSTKGINKAEGDFAKCESLAKDAIEAAKKSAPLIPAKVGKMTDAAAKAKATEEYKKQIDDLVKGFEKVQAAAAAKDAAKLKDAVEALGKIKKSGHEAFMED